ncbi:MAG: hypothetical protein KJ058_04770 [Thermoanaerobaculia bacterium]|nr:hypothetical protein [Thermoanaerobaculia bacterium]
MAFVLLFALVLGPVLPGADPGDPAPAVNWALGAPARQSSTRSGCEAARAVDGEREGERAARSVALTKSEPDSFWEVDLGAVREVEEIRVFLCREGCGARLRDLAVFVSEEPFRHGAAKETMLQLGVSFALVWGPLGDPADGRERAERQTIPIRARGRWVRLQPVEGGSLALAEVEVLGPASPPLPTAAPRGGR